MLRSDRIFAFLMVLICGFYFLSSLKLSVGTINDTGPGFIPRLLGVGGLLLAVIIFIKSLKKNKDSNPQKVSGLPKDAKFRFFGCVIACIIFIPLFELVQPIAAVFILILSLTKIWESNGWLRPIVLATVSSVSAYVLFSILLEVPLPRGIF